MMMMMNQVASVQLQLGGFASSHSGSLQTCRDGVTFRPCVWDRGNSSHRKSFDKVVCMAHPRRVKMVQQQIHRELADMLLHDTVLQQAIAPESSLGADMYLSSMATISDVEISKDLQVAKVFISIYGDEREQEIALEGLKSKAKYVRMGLGKRMSLRMTPEVRFVKDESLERGSRVLDLLDRVKEDRERKESGDTSPSQLITPVDDDDFDLDFEENDEAPITPKPKKKSKTKAPPKPSAKKVAADDNDFDWDDEEFRDLDFNDDENIIFINRRFCKGGMVDEVQIFMNGYSGRALPALVFSRLKQTSARRGIANADNAISQQLLQRRTRREESETKERLSVGAMAELELLELFEKADKAARKAFVNAAGVVDDAEESRCTEALKAIGAVDISTPLLLSTQVGKRLRKLTKHASLKISSSAQQILQDWKTVVSSEACSNTNSVKKMPDSLPNSVPSSLGTESDISVAMPSTVHVKSTKFSQIKVEVIEVTKMESKTIETRSTVTTVVTDVNMKNDQCNSAPVARVDSSSSIIQELAPQIGQIPKAGGDSARNRVRQLMVEALAKVWKEAGDDDLEKIKSVDIVQVAVAVENAMFAKLGLSKGKEKAKYRSIMFNIKDDKNPDFRRRVVLGKVKPEAVCTLTSDEMASDQRKKETEDIKAKAMFECERGMQAVASTDQFKCAKCGQRKTTYFQMQTRSADEPMTTFVSCLNCSARWKFS